MGRFSIEFNVANQDDVSAVRLGLLDAGKVRRLTVRGVVDSGAAQFVLPQAIVKQLGLVDCTHQRLVPHDPRYVVSEIE